jgi:hypothetical protein
MNRYNDAINICLTTIGESPIPASTSIVGHYEAELADTIISESLTEVLAFGYNFNTDSDWELVPDTSGNIAIPAGAISVDASTTSSDYIMKSAKLYNKATMSYVFTETVLADITWAIDFNDLQPIIQILVVAKAKMKLYTRVVGVDTAYKVFVQEVEDATTAVRAEDITSGDYSIFDDTVTSRVMTRTSNPLPI